MTTKPNKLNAGDRVAYAAKFLRNTLQFTGNAPQRRGTFVSYTTFGSQTDNYARVHWDDEAAMIASRAGQFAEQDYCDDVRAHGSLVCAANIAKVGSPRFSHSDL
jgi:hypothetical protein